MSGKLHYGKIAYGLDRDLEVAVYRLLIQRIVESGHAEWLPLPTEIDGERATVDLLITPGVPIYFTSDTHEGVLDATKALMDKYMPAESNDDVESATVALP